MRIIGELRKSNFRPKPVQTDMSLSTPGRAAEILFEASCSSNNEGAEGRALGEGASGALIDLPPLISP